MIITIGILTRTWGGSAIGGDIVLELTPSFFLLILITIK